MDKSNIDFVANVTSGERSYPFHSGEVETLKGSLNKVKKFLNGVHAFPTFTKYKGTYYASKIILENNNNDVRDCFEKYKQLHPVSSHLAQGSPNPKDRFLRMLSVFTEAGAISIKDYKIIFGPVLLKRLSSLQNVSSYINIKISGTPFAKNKIRGNLLGPQQWSKHIVSQTKDLPKINEACILHVTFLLPPVKFPKDYPFGSDLDNLLKRFFDALNETIFSEAKGKDSCVISLHASKVKVNSESEAGALLEIIPIKI
jgi:hypothetical protein